ARVIGVRIPNVVLPLGIASETDSRGPGVGALRFIAAVGVTCETDLVFVAALGEEFIGGGLAAHTENWRRYARRLGREALRSSLGLMTVVAIEALGVALRAGRGFGQRELRRVRVFRLIMHRGRDHHWVLILFSELELDVEVRDRAVVALEAGVFFRQLYQALSDLRRVRLVAAFTSVVGDSHV